MTNNEMQWQVADKLFSKNEIKKALHYMLEQSSKQNKNLKLFCLYKSKRFKVSETKFYKRRKT